MKTKMQTPPTAKEGLTDFHYKIDRKVTIWERSAYTVQAESEERAKELIIEEAKDLQYDDNSIESPAKECVNFLTTQFLFETNKAMTPSENGMQATIEVGTMYGDTNKDVWDNAGEGEPAGAKLEHIQSTHNHSDGGGITMDVVVLKSGKVIRITAEEIAIYADEDASLPLPQPKPPLLDEFMQLLTVDAEYLKEKGEEVMTLALLQQRIKDFKTLQGL